ncbi:autotransporter passenger strand-loop-strand repeat protein, partial [Bartonella callosciuri]
MRYKCRLSFSVLMISSCFVQVASAAEKRSLTKLENLTSGGTVQKGSALITTSVSSNIMVVDGGVEIVENGKSSMGATIEKGGMQIVTRGGTAVDAKILGGKQFIYEENNLEFTSVIRKSSAYNATVSGGGRGAIGQQNVYDGGKAWNTKVMNGGEQNLYMGSKKMGGGFAENTMVSGNGRQHILAEGMATNTTLSSEAVQVVYSDGIVDGLTINDYASSWIHVAAELTGKIQINGKGCLYLFAGDRTDHTTKEKLSVGGRADEWLFRIGERDNTKKSQINIEDLGGEGGSVIFASIPYDPRHISLYVEKLSGNLNFHFNISAMGAHNSDYLWVDSSSGTHTISVADSGAEITNFLSQKNGLISEINLVADRSQNGGANFTLADRSGKKIEAVDGGTYVYGLHKRERNAESSGDTTTWYLGRESQRSGHESTRAQRTSRKPKTPVSLVLSSSDAGAHSQERSSSSRVGSSTSRNTTGRQNSEQTSRPRPPRHLREAQHVSALPLEDQPVEVSRLAFYHHASDEKQQPIVVS